MYRTDIQPPWKISEEGLLSLTLVAVAPLFSSLALLSLYSGLCVSKPERFSCYFGASFHRTARQSSFRLKLELQRVS